MDGTGDIRVLHVDDNAALRDLTAELLEQVDDGLSVTSEADPTAVPGRVDREDVHCVVSDYDMPELDGLALCDRIRADRPEIPFFLFTSRADEALVDRAMAVGVTDYLQKEPGVLQYKLLANRIRNAVRHHRARQRIAELTDAA